MRKLVALTCVLLLLGAQALAQGGQQVDAEALAAGIATAAGGVI